MLSNANRNTSSDAVFFAIGKNLAIPIPIHTTQNLNLNLQR